MTSYVKKKVGDVAKISVEDTFEALLSCMHTASKMTEKLRD